MSIATVVLSILLAAFLAFSAIRKLTHQPAVVESYARAGVPEDWLNHLAIILSAASAGLIAGLFFAPIGIAAAIGIIIYFLGAVGFHIRANDMKHLPTPLLVAVFAALVLILQVAFAEVQEPTKGAATMRDSDMMADGELAVPRWQEPLQALDALDSIAGIVHTPVGFVVFSYAGCVAAYRNPSLIRGVRELSRGAGPRPSWGTL